MSDATAILYVEDEPLIRELVAMILQDGWFKALIMPNGAAALHALEANAASICIVITDINLGIPPDGWEVARCARTLNNSVPVIYVSGDSTHEWTSKGVSNSVMIRKPFNDTQIMDAISSLLKGDGMTQPSF